MLRYDCTFSKIYVTIKDVDKFEGFKKCVDIKRRMFVHDSGVFMY